MIDVAAELEALAALHAVPGRAENEQRYLKLPTWRFHGAPIPKIRGVARAWTREERPSLEQRLALADALWDTDPPVWERRRLAAELVEERRVVLGLGHVDWLERRLRTSRTWALVDSLSIGPLGRVVSAHPDEMGPVLDRWVLDPDFWIRRAAVLALLEPIRAGAGDWARFTRYAELLAPETEFFIRKALGWVLREASKKSPERVERWLTEHCAVVSGLTLREGSKRLDPQVIDALKARRAALT